jgi:hypothetical protein
MLVVFNYIAKSNIRLIGTCHLYFCTNIAGPICLLYLTTQPTLARASLRYTVYIPALTPLGLYVIL